MAQVKFTDEELHHLVIDQNIQMRSALEDIRDLQLKSQGGDTQGQTCCREAFRMRKMAEEGIACAEDVAAKYRASNRAAQEEKP